MSVCAIGFIGCFEFLSDFDSLNPVFLVFGIGKFDDFLNIFGSIWVFF